MSRAPLIEAARAGDAVVVGITAPAGYGKSTLLAQWADMEDRRVGWVSLDRLDDDPSALLVLLASAYDRSSPEQTTLVADVSGPGVSALGRGAPYLASTLRNAHDPFVLMLDDLHELRSPACHDVLSVVIAGIPHGSQLVMASRAEQSHLPRLRASGDAVELRTSDLALDALGAEQIFSTAHAPLTAEQAAAVTERTEGWPVGLYLAATIAREAGKDPASVSGDDRYVADYLYQEALSRLDENTQRYLRRTAVLDQLHGPLCDALLGATGGQDTLQELEASNSFLIPLDRRRQWYRYHPLFREFLLGELRRTEPDIIVKLHRLAAGWYEANGSAAIALEHLLNTTERDRCIQLVAGLVLPTYATGQISTVERWLSALGDTAIEGYPPLAVLAGWIATLSGHTGVAQRWATVLDAASFDLVPLDGTASFDSSRAMLRAVMCAAGPEQMMADATLAVEQEPPWSPWRDTALYLLGAAHRLSGDLDAALPLFAESSAAGVEIGHTDTIALSESELALAAMDRNQWTDAAESVARALAVVEQHRIHDYATSVLAFAAAARLALHDGDLAATQRELTRAMRARPACTFVLPYWAVNGRVLLTKTFWALGDRSTARHLLREIDDVMLHRPDLGILVDEVASLRETLTSHVSDAATGGPPLTAAELRVLPYLQTHLTIAEIGGRLFVSRNTVSSEVASIYRKLGVSSRSEAVVQATAVGLLGA